MRSFVPDPYNYYSGAYQGTYAPSGGGATYIQWLLPFSLNATATTPDDGSGDASNASTSGKYCEVYNSSLGKSLEFVSAGNACVQGMRLATTVADGAEVSTENIVGDPTFDGGWWLTAGGASVSGGKLVFTAAVNNSGAYKTNFSKAGTEYTVTYTIDSISSGAILLKISNFGGTTRNAPGTYTEKIIAPTDGSVTLYSSGASTTAVIDNAYVYPTLPTFLNSVSAADSSPLSPVNSAGEYIVMDAWPGATQVVALGDYCVGKVGNHFYYYKVTTAGTTDATEPVWTDSGTQADGTAVWTFQGRYNNMGPSWLTHVMTEPLAVNLAWPSNDLTNANVTKLTATATTDTITADGSTSPHGVRYPFGAINDTVTGSAILEAGTQNFGFIGIYDGTNYNGIGVDLITGAVVESGTVDSYSVKKVDGGFRVIVTETVNTTTYMHIGMSLLATPPAYSAGRPSDSSSGTIKARDVNFVIGSVATSPIVTLSGAATRQADVWSSTYAITTDKYRYRIAAVKTETHLTDSTNSFSYDGSDLIVTDGTNTLTHTVALAVGDLIGWDNATGKLYINGVNVATDATVVQSWGAITGRGNITDILESTALVLTDTLSGEPQ